MCILDLFIFFCFLIMNKSRYSRFVSFKIHENNAFGMWGSGILVSLFFVISISEVFIEITIYFVCMSQRKNLINTNAHMEMIYLNI